MAYRKIFYSELCILGEDSTSLGLPGEFLYRDGGAWKLNEVSANLLYCDMANSGAQGQRIMAWAPWGKHPAGIMDQFAPYVLEGNRFQLRTFNDWYFPMVRRLIEIAGTYDLETWFALNDSCQFHDFQGSKRWSPWVTNVNGLTTLWEDGAHDIFEAFVRECILQFKGLKIAYTLGNEMNVSHFVEICRKVLFPMVNEGLFDKEKLALGATAKMGNYSNGAYSGGAGIQDEIKKLYGNLCGEEAKRAAFREVHGIGGGNYPAVPNILDCILYWWGSHPTRVFFSDDGVWDGESPCDFQVSTGRRRPSPARWTKVIQTARNFTNDFIFEHLPKGGSLACQKAVIKAMYRALFDKDPVEKWHYSPPPPPPVMVKRKFCAHTMAAPGPYCPEVIEISVPETDPAAPLCAVHVKPPAPASCYERFIKNRPFWKWQVGAFIKCLLGR